MAGKKRQTGDVKTFTWSGHELRAVVVAGNPWFVAKDVCGMLGLGNPSKALRALDIDEKGITTGNTPGGKQALATINESGLYSLILRSRKPEAKAFKKWVTSEVLPSIRKTGQYSETLVDSLLDNPQKLRLLVDRFAESKLAEQGAKEEAVKARATVAKAKKAVAESAAVHRVLLNEVTAIADDAATLQQLKERGHEIQIGSFAKLLASLDCPVGRNRLFEILRTLGYFMKEGRRITSPKQEYIDRGWFKKHMVQFQLPDDAAYDGKRAACSYTPYITSKGVAALWPELCDYFGIKKDVTEVLRMLVAYEDGLIPMNVE